MTMTKHVNSTRSSGPLGPSGPFYSKVKTQGLFHSFKFPMSQISLSLLLTIVMYQKKVLSELTLNEQWQMIFAL